MIRVGNTARYDVHVSLTFKWLKFNLGSHTDKCNLIIGKVTVKYVPVQTSVMYITVA